jgi:hypothetical protein
LLSSLAHSPGARPGLCLSLLFFLAVFAAGCAGTRGIRISGVGQAPVVYDPPAASAAFKKLRIEISGAIVILPIEGADPYLVMGEIQQILLRKGYLVRDAGETMKALGEKSLLARAPFDPRTIDGATKIFGDEAAITGRVLGARGDRSKAILELYWYRLKDRKKILTMKAPLAAGNALIFDSGSLDERIIEGVRRGLAAIPRAAP